MRGVGWVDSCFCRFLLLESELIFPFALFVFHIQPEPLLFWLVLASWCVRSRSDSDCFHALSELNPWHLIFYLRVHYL